MKLRRTSVAAPLATVAVLAAGCGGNPGGQAGQTPTSQPSFGAGSTGKSITVGAASFAENEILAQMYAQALDNAGYQASVKVLSSREVIIPALKNGQLAVEPDYAATLLEYLDKGKGLASPSLRQTVARLRNQLRGTNLAALKPANAVDTNGFAVRKNTAQKLNLQTLSDLKGHAPTMVLGGAPECPQRPFCLPGLKKVYGLHFKNFVPLDAGGPLTRQALNSGKIDVGELFTTDPTIDQYGFVLLADNKNLQNADNVIPIVNQKVMSTKLQAALNGVQSKLTTEALRKLNGQVVLQHKKPEAVAKAWLQQNGLL